MASYPAVGVEGALDELTLAVVDEFSPTAVEERDGGARIFFAGARQRDAAFAALTDKGMLVTRLDVDDEDWARRSQQNLTPITVGRITVLPTRQPPIPHRSPICVVIEQSMGFGTGHHATTRLCLAALQQTNLADAFVLDVGTGSGILAIAAARLGATSALGLDSDPNAIQSANENLALNPDARGVRFAVADLLVAPLPRADVVTANLTGALLARIAGLLLHALNPGGTLILGGILAAEEQAVHRAFSTANQVWRQEEEEWIGLTLTPGARPGHVETRS